MICPTCGTPYTWQGSMSSGGLQPSCGCAAQRQCNPIEKTLDDYAEQVADSINRNNELAKRMRRPQVPPPCVDPVDPNDPMFSDPDYIWRLYSQGRIGAVEAYKRLELIRAKPTQLGARDKATRVIREIMYKEYNPKPSQPEDDKYVRPNYARHSDDSPNPTQGCEASAEGQPKEDIPRGWGNSLTDCWRTRK